MDRPYRFLPAYDEHLQKQIIHLDYIIRHNQKTRKNETKSKWLALYIYKYYPSLLCVNRYAYYLNLLKSKINCTHLYIDLMFYVDVDSNTIKLRINSNFYPAQLFLYKHLSCLLLFNDNNPNILDKTRLLKLEGKIYYIKYSETNGYYIECQSSHYQYLLELVKSCSLYNDKHVDTLTHYYRLFEQNLHDIRRIL